jgi:hypothetical protein
MALTLDFSTQLILDPFEKSRVRPDWGAQGVRMESQSGPWKLLGALEAFWVSLGVGGWWFKMALTLDFEAPLI